MWQTHDVDSLIDQRDQLRTERDELQQLWQAKTHDADELRRQRDTVVEVLSIIMGVLDEHMEYTNAKVSTYQRLQDARRILAQYDKEGDA